MTDVVTAAGQRWSRDPFGAELVDGVVWGRGALDGEAATDLQMGGGSDDPAGASPTS